MKVPTVSEEPTCRLSHWIFAEALECYFLVGYQHDFTTARRTTPLAWVNVDNLTCRTMSGRIYVLDLPWATGDVATSLLNLFRENQGVIAVDSTINLLSDPNLLYKKFSLPDANTRHLMPAEPRLKKMVAEPSVWLHKLTNKLTASDVDPALLKLPLGLNELQWQLFMNETLSSVSMACAFRGLLIEQIFSMADEVISANSGRDPLSIKTSSPGIAFGVLDTGETHELINLYCAWVHCVADYEAQNVVDGVASSNILVHRLIHLS